ncbi:MAG: diaminopimelate dehydrogenase [Clostridia bacterium]
MIEKKIKIAICGYGNLGKAVDNCILNYPDLKLEYVITRRDIVKIQSFTTAMVIDFNNFVDNIHTYKDKIDVVILCGGSATDLVVHGPIFSKYFNTIDSFDIHEKIPDYLKMIDDIAKANYNLSCISVGWDPGLFSINRIYANAILPTGYTNTFWGRGVSQGHSNAIKKIVGVKNAVQYTIPNDEIIDKVRNTNSQIFTKRQKHKRECFVVVEENADKNIIENQIKTMPNYFEDYDTIVHFVSEGELKTNHDKLSHAGVVIHSANIDGNRQVIEYSLKLDSNPTCTASILLTYARAIYHMRQNNITGAITVYDVAPILLSNKNRLDVITNFL